MIDILVYLLTNYHDFGARPKMRTLRRNLSAVGFEDQAIRDALRWLDGLETAVMAEVPACHRAMRVYLAQEQGKLGTDCMGFIAFLERTALLTPALRELVVERAMLLDDHPVPLAKLKVIVLMVLWSRDQNLEPLVIEELLGDGDSRSLH